MKKRFERSAETAALVDLFLAMKVGVPMSFDEASQKLGFTITSQLSSYSSAKEIAKRDNILIESIRSFGFQRLVGLDMVKRGHRVRKEISRKAHRGARDQEIALTQNLDRNAQAVASDHLMRFRLVGDIVAGKAATNRAIVETPELVATSEQ